jgi:hypothetical protein
MAVKVSFQASAMTGRSFYEEISTDNAELMQLLGIPQKREPQHIPKRLLVYRIDSESLKASIRVSLRGLFAKVFTLTPR